MLILPWPDRLLSPNVRSHWAAKAKATKAARKLAGWETKVRWNGIPAIAQITAGDGDIHLWVTLNPPDKRKRDRDNMLASLKAYTDGVADGLGVNDSRFIIRPHFGGAFKGGRVIVQIGRPEGVFFEAAA